MTCEVIDRDLLTLDTRSAGPSGAIRRRAKMTDINTVAHRYIELWNERTPSRRREILAANWADDAKYLDPLMSGDGHDGVDALIAGVQQRFPDFRFQLIGEPNGFGDHVRFSWGLGPDGSDSPIKGTDFAVLQDGRIRSITGFLDQVPQGA
jgi:SnoaL-like protein